MGPSAQISVQHLDLDHGLEQAAILSSILC
jgi:hypothetical protein